MYNRYKNLLKILLLSILMMAEVFASGGKRNGTAGAQELLIPVGARGMAFNGAYISGLDGIDAIYYNPAGLGTMPGAQAMFSYMNYIADIGVSYAAVGAGFEGFGSLAFSVKSINFGDIPVTTTENPYGTGATFSPTFVTLGLTYANMISDRIKVGFTANMVTEKIVRTSATGIAFDMGVQYNDLASIEGLQIGIVLKNFGPQITFDGPDLLRTADALNTLRGDQFYKIQAAGFELPSQLELGIAYQKKFSDDYAGLITTTFQNNNFANDEYLAAAEFSFKDLIFFRGGYCYEPDASTDEEQIFGPTYGAGLKFNTGIAITVDYAYRTVRYFDANHMVSVKLAF
jgi:hypothetical protein